MYIILTYDAEAVCGSKDACFGAFGTFDDWDAADEEGKIIAEENGLDYEILAVSEPNLD